MKEIMHILELLVTVQVVVIHLVNVVLVILQTHVCS